MIRRNFQQRSRRLITWPKSDSMLRLFIFCNNKVIREWIFMTTLWTLCNSLLIAGYALPWCDPLWATRPLDEQFRYAPLYCSPCYGCCVFVMHCVMSEWMERSETWICFEFSDETWNSVINYVACNLPKYTRSRRRIFDFLRFKFCLYVVSGVVRRAHFIVDASPHHTLHL
jgi:hypothetical protein